jgi:hypothetical protein
VKALLLDHRSATHWANWISCFHFCAEQSKEFITSSLDKSVALWNLPVGNSHCYTATNFNSVAARKIPFCICTARQSDHSCSTSRNHCNCALSHHNVHCTAITVCALEHNIAGKLTHLCASTLSQAGRIVPNQQWAIPFWPNDARCFSHLSLPLRPASVLEAHLLWADILSKLERHITVHQKVADSKACNPNPFAVG